MRDMGNEEAQPFTSRRLLSNPSDDQASTLNMPEIRKLLDSIPAQADMKPSHILEYLLSSIRASHPNSVLQDSRPGVLQERSKVTRNV